MGLFSTLFLVTSLLPFVFTASQEHEELVEEVFKAIRNGDISELLNILEKHNPVLGDFINLRDKTTGQTPLMMAVLHGKDDAVGLLLEKDDVDVTIPEKDGYTPMHGAGFQGRANILSMLLADRRSALDPEEFHKDGFSPFHRACWGTEKRHTDTVAVFIEKGNVPWNQKTRKGRTCMEITTNSGTKKWLKNYSKKLREF